MSDIKTREMKRATIERAAMLGKTLGAKGFLEKGIESVDWDEFGASPEKKKRALELILKEPDGAVDEMTTGDWKWLVANFWKETNKIGISLGSEPDSLRDTMMARVNSLLPDTNSASQSIPLQGEIQS